MFSISKEFHFSASHILNGLEEGHPCGRMHGHNYIVRVFLRSQTLNDVSFVQDYGELKPINDFINEYLDHRHLNEIIIGQPSAENIAMFLFWKFKSNFPKLYAIEVQETPKTNCRYEPAES